MRSLAAAGYSVADVRLLVATHTHSDHVGPAARVIEESGCRFLMHEASAHFYDAMRESERSRRPAAAGAGREGVPDERLDDFGDVREEIEGVLEPVEPDEALRDGMRLPSTLGDWEVVETPGHAPSHVCLVQRERGVAIVGDLVARAFAPYFDYGYTPDPVGELLASYDRVGAIDGIRLGLPGHGRPLDDLTGTIETYRSGIHARLEDARAAVGAGPAGAYEVAPAHVRRAGVRQTAVGRPPRSSATSSTCATRVTSSVTRTRPAPTATGWPARRGEDHDRRSWAVVRRPHLPVHAAAPAAGVGRAATARRARRR